QESHDVVQRNRLPHTATPQDAQCLPRPHVKAHVVEHALLAERLAHMLELDVRRRELGIVRHLGVSLILASSFSAPSNRKPRPNHRYHARFASLSSSGVFRFRNMFRLKPPFCSSPSFT